MNADYELSVPSEQQISKALDKAKYFLDLERSAGGLTGGRVSSGLLELEIPENLVIVGDLHGDLHIFQKILAAIGSEFISSPKNKLIFLGDYVDRGSNSIEVLYELCNLKSSYPDSVILMRGNHEAPLVFPFTSHSLLPELRREFGDSCPSIYGKILSMFESLPLMTIIQSSMVLVHGGLPVLYHYPGSRSIMSNDLHHKRLMEELLWNDPKDSIENSYGWEKSRRPFGFHFGEEITRKWLNDICVKVLVRGHEPCAGVRVYHSGLVVTVFSSQEAYPLFAPAFINISGRELSRIRTADDFIPRCVRLL